MQVIGSLQMLIKMNATPQSGEVFICSSSKIHRTASVMFLI